jgi:hypothetical protein
MRPHGPGSPMPTPCVPIWRLRHESGRKLQSAREHRNKKEDQFRFHL